MFALLGQRGAAFIASLVLARFLSEADFGVVAISLGVITIAEMLRTAGIVQAFVVYRGDENEARHTVFWLGICTGVLSCAAMIIIAPVIANWFDAPQVAPVLRVLSITQVIDSFRMVPYAMLLRHYRFRDRSLAESLPMVFAVPAAIVSALQLPEGHRYWALVVLYLVKYTMSAVTYMYFSPQIPRRKFDNKIARELNRASFPILLSNIPNSAIDSISKLVAGLRVSVAAVGAFNLAGSITTPPTFVTHAANWTLFPIIANNAHDPERVRAYLCKALTSVGLISSSILGWMIVVVPDLIPILFGAKWITIVAPTQWLCLATIVRNHALMGTNAMLAAGKAKQSAVVWWITLGSTSGAMLAWPTARETAVGMSIAFFVASTFGFVLAMAATCRAFALSATNAAIATVAGYAPAAIASAASFASLLLTRDTGAGVRLVVATLTFAVVLLPVSGVLIAGGWAALLTPAGIRNAIKNL